MTDEERRKRVVKKLTDRGMGAFADEIADALVRNYKHPENEAKNCEFYIGAVDITDVAWAEVRENCPEIWQEFIDLGKYGEHLESVNEYQWTENGAIYIA